MKSSRKIYGKGLWIPVLVLCSLAFGGAVLTSASSDSNFHLQQTSTQNQTATLSSVASNGIRLTTSVSPTTIQSGESLNITEDLFNTHLVQNNVSAAVSWPLPSLAGLCPGGIVAEALYAGNLTTSTISSATPLPSHGPGSPSCPALPVYANYIFQPNSDSATALSSSFSSANSGTSDLSFRAHDSFTLNSYYDPSVSNFVHFKSGDYTLLVGDIWGSFVLLHFTVG